MPPGSQGWSAAELGYEPRTLAPPAALLLLRGAGKEVGTKLRCAWSWGEERGGPQDVGSPLGLPCPSSGKRGNPGRGSGLGGRRGQQGLKRTKISGLHDARRKVLARGHRQQCPTICWDLRTVTRAPVHLMAGT